MNRLNYIAVALSFLVAGCQQQRAVDRPVDPTNIHLTGGVRSMVASKASVATGDRFTAAVCGWQGVSSTVDWSAEPTWSSSAEVVAGSTATAIVLVPARTYDLKGLISVVRAWYPTGTLSGGRVEFDNPTADADVMLSGAVAGSLSAPIGDPLLFYHLTTQLRFVLAGAWYADEPIVSLVIQGVRVPQGLDLVAGELVEGAVQDVMVPGVSAGGVLPTAEGAAFGREVMVVPIKGNRIKVDITTPRKSYNDVEVTTADAQFTAGRSYTVTLTFSGDRTIKVGSQVGDWSEASHSQGDLR